MKRWICGGLVGALLMSACIPLRESTSDERSMAGNATETREVLDTAQVRLSPVFDGTGLVVRATVPVMCSEREVTHVSVVRTTRYRIDGWTRQQRLIWAGGLVAAGAIFAVVSPYSTEVESDDGSTRDYSGPFLGTGLAAIASGLVVASTIPASRLRERTERVELPGETVPDAWGPSVECGASPSPGQVVRLVVDGDVVSERLTDETGAVAFDLSATVSSWAAEIEPQSEEIELAVEHDLSDVDLSETFRAQYLAQRVDYRLHMAETHLGGIESVGDSRQQNRDATVALRWLQTPTVTQEQHVRRQALESVAGDFASASRGDLIAECTESQPERIRLWTSIRDSSASEADRLRSRMPTAVEYVDLAREVTEEIDNEFCAYVYRHGCAERRAQVRYYCPGASFTGCTRWEEVDAYNQRAVRVLEDLAEAMHSGDYDRIAREADDADVVLQQIEFNALSISGYSRLRRMVGSIGDDALEVGRLEDLERLADTALENEAESHVDGDWMYVVEEAAGHPDAPPELGRVFRLLDEAAAACEALSTRYQ